MIPQVRLDVIARYHGKHEAGPLCKECLLPWPCRSWRAAVLEPRKDDQSWQHDKQMPVHTSSEPKPSGFEPKAEPEA